MVPPAAELCWLEEEALCCPPPPADVVDCPPVVVELDQAKFEDEDELADDEEEFDHDCVIVLPTVESDCITDAVELGVVDSEPQSFLFTK